MTTNGVLVKLFGMRRGHLTSYPCSNVDGGLALVNEHQLHLQMRTPWPVSRLFRNHLKKGSLFWYREPEAARNGDCKFQTVEGVVDHVSRYFEYLVINNTNNIDIRRTIYWAARKGNSQSRITFRLCRKWTKWRTELHEDFACPIPLNRADFRGERTGHFRLSGDQTWKSIRNEHKIIAWNCWPCIYAEWLSKYSIRWGS